MEFPQSVMNYFHDQLAWELADYADEMSKELEKVIKNNERRKGDEPDAARREWAENVMCNLASTIHEAFKNVTEVRFGERTLYLTPNTVDEVLAPKKRSVPIP